MQLVTLRNSFSPAAECNWSHLGMQLKDHNTNTDVSLSFSCSGASLWSHCQKIVMRMRKKELGDWCENGSEDRCI